MINIPWDSVPWAVGGGAVHSSEVARLVTYIATAGQQGVLGPLDLQVLPLSVPGAGVRVQPGACVIVNKALNVFNDSYVARLPSEDIVSTTANGSSGLRYDLVVARVENPFISGEAWSTPNDVTIGPYIFTRIIQNVPAATKSVDELALGYSAIPLARIAWPLNTATVTSGMITDLRGTVNLSATTPSPAPGSDGGDVAPTVIYIVLPGTGDTIAYTQTSYTDWPSAAQWSVYAPKWCTHLELDIKIDNIAVALADFHATFRVLVNGVSVLTKDIDVHLQAAGKVSRGHVHLGVDYKLPSALRGKSVPVKVQCKFYSESRTNNCVATADAVMSTHAHHRHHCRPCDD